MSTTITDGTVTTTPDLVLTMEYSSDVRDLVHPVLDREDPDVTLRPTSLRSGTLELFYADHAAAIAAHELLREQGVFNLANDVDPWKSMDFVKQDRLGLRREGEHARWVVFVGYQEVRP